MNAAQLALHLAFKRAGERLTAHLLAVALPAKLESDLRGDLMTRIHLEHADIMQAVVLPAVLA